MTTMTESMVAGDVWQGALEKIQTHISSQTFETWFRSLGPLDFDGSAMVLEVPSQFYVDWLDHHYRGLIESSLAAVAGHPVILAFQVRTPEPPVRSEEHTSELQSHVNLVCRLLLEKKKKKAIAMVLKKQKQK